jgi:putative PIN family toxin of toxin-antitoxin system
MKAVIDTNVFVSAVLGGKTARVLDSWRAHTFSLIVTSDIVDEYQTVLRRPKFKLPPHVVDGIIDRVYRRAIFVTPQVPIAVVASDPSDNKFLEAAVTGAANVIVSGDKHLLELGVFHVVQIIRVTDFLNMV